MGFIRDFDGFLPFVEAPQGERPVELGELEIQAVVSGPLVEVTHTMRFFNPNQRVLEGSLVLPLPEGAAVCGYALDVGGRMVDGVVVPKHEARRILEAEVRRGVDPGLVEQVQGNLYRTRVYPLPAGGCRTVRVTFVSELDVDGTGASWHLPLGFAARVGRVHLRVEVVQSPVEPILLGGPGNLEPGPWEGRWMAEATLPSGQACDDLVVRLPDLPERFAVVEETSQGELFVCASLAREPGEGVAIQPERVAVAWDASGSRLDTGRELAFLRALAERWPGPADLVVFRDQVEEPRPFASLRALADHLQSQAADGCTALGELDLSRLPHPETRAWLLFSDGLGTSQSLLPRTGAAPVFCLTSQARNHAAALQLLAEGTGGCFLNLLHAAPERAAERVASHSIPGSAPYLTGGTDVHLRRSAGRTLVLARLLGQGLPATLTCPGHPPLELDVKTARRGRLVARAWAGREAALQELQGQDPVALAALGRRYNLVTPGTSLLVLDTLEQFLEYDLEPPETLPEVREAFLARRQEVRLEQESTRSSHLEQVVRLWAQRVAWWETEFKPVPPPPPEALFSLGSGTGLGAPMSPSMPRCAPAAAPSITVDLLPLDDGACVPPPAFLSGTFEGEEAAPPMDLCMEVGEPAPADVSSQGARIDIQPWTPDTPYLTAMRQAGDGAYAAYLEQRPQYSGSPAFFLDCGDHLLSAGQRQLGLRVLSNLEEMALDDPALLRMYAWRLAHAGELDAAIGILEKVLLLRQDEPQSWRDLALLLGDRWERDGDQADAARAVALLYEVVQRQWERFPEIEIIALMELNRLLQRTEAAGVQVPPIDPRLRRLLDLDLRISMSWDSDLTDVDLHVLEPTGEHAYYAHQQTAIGGLVSRDFRDGYGPEEYVLRRAVPGDYSVKARYYGSHQQTLTGPCTVLVHVFTDYGRDTEARRVLILRLERPGDEIPVGQVTMT